MTQERSIEAEDNWCKSWEILHGDNVEKQENYMYIKKTLYIRMQNIYLWKDIYLGI